MSDKFFPLPPEQLLQLILNQYDSTRYILGIPEELFFHPSPADTFQFTRFGVNLESPIGVAAGPHTQLSQNIVASWLTGARFIELKTIQTLDELDVSKPCIDMQDEGYNCEWSQELKIHDSFDQYLDAWILIHILKDKLRIGSPGSPGFIFNMSVGYNLEGILKDNVQWFLAKMDNATEELEKKIGSLQRIYPRIKKLSINPRISDSVALSTMHGCPPDEIEKIGAYLINEKKLHTTIKFNPTLLGREAVHSIFSKNGFDTQIPDIAFEHDLKYPEALNIIRSLQSQADRQNLKFSLKLTNTLESKNNKPVFDSSQKMMYMSGRALHPVSVKLAGKLQNDFSGKLDISFSGGADAFNVTELVKSGLAPVTVCTDLLKPGGYGRLHQYIGALRASGITVADSSYPGHLNRYADEVLENEDYRRTSLKIPDIKTGRPLGFFDCIHAPCESTCPTNQGIPDYLYYTANNNLAEAARVVAQTNPFPNTTGMVCDHLCQTKCTRINYDSPVLIREVKRVIAEHAPSGAWKSHSPKPAFQKFRAAVIGAGPSGLSCAWFLAQAGFEVEIFEANPGPGGMVSGAIPEFRLTGAAISLDVNRITGLGIKVNYGTRINGDFFNRLRGNNDFVYVAAGAQRSKPFHLPGSDVAGVIDPLKFLFEVKSGRKERPGKNVVIIGGGNTAMDAARTAYRLVGEDGKVTIAYRRTIKEMPADLGEIKAVLEEGVEILEMTAPVKIKSEQGKAVAIICRKMKAGPKDESGRPKPLEISGSDFEIPADAIIPAIGQELDLEFLNDANQPLQSGSYETTLPGVYIGGDALRGASTAINAIGDGRKAAQEMIDKAGLDFQTKSKNPRPEKSFRQHIIDKAKRIKSVKIEETPLSDRKNFKLVQSPLLPGQGIAEAGRCLLCDEVCSVCTTVCPNLALMTYEVEPVKYELQKITFRDGNVRFENNLHFEITQKYQILHLADWCNRCGNCTTFCPTSGAPWLDKPHFFMSKSDFENEKDGFYFEQNKLYGKFGNSLYSLEKLMNGFQFSNQNISIKLDDRLNIERYQLLQQNNFEVDIQKAALMKTVLEGVEFLKLKNL